MDCAGCTACECVHRCSAVTCTDVETTEDALVYRITVCVSGQRFADCEFSENVIVFASSANVTDTLERRMQAVAACAHEFLVSSHAHNIAVYENAKRLQKHRAHVSRCLHTGCANLLQLVQLGMPLFPGRESKSVGSEHLEIK